MGESPDCLLLSGTVVGENPDHVCWVLIFPRKTARFRKCLKETCKLKKKLLVYNIIIFNKPTKYLQVISNQIPP